MKNLTLKELYNRAYLETLRIVEKDERKLLSRNRINDKANTRLSKHGAQLDELRALILEEEKIEENQMKLVKQVKKEIFSAIQSMIDIEYGNLDSEDFAKYYHAWVVLCELDRRVQRIFKDNEIE